MMHTSKSRLIKSAAAVAAFLTALAASQPSTYAASGLATISADGSNLKNVVNGRNIIAGAWSSDGSVIAYSVSKSSGKDAIFRVNADGTGKKKLAVKRRLFIVSGLSFSPDGKSLAFANLGGSDKPSIYTIGVDGSGEKLILKNASDPAWSPDGSLIAFTRCGRKCNIYTASTSGTGVKRVAKNGFGPKWSSDGQSIAFARVNSMGVAAKTTFFTVKKDGTGLSQLVKLPNLKGNRYPVQFDLSSDLQKVVVAYEWYGSNDIYAGFDVFTMNIGGSGKTKILQRHNLSSLAMLKWSPDASKILLVTSQGADI